MAQHESFLEELFESEKETTVADTKPAPRFGTEPTGQMGELARLSREQRLNEASLLDEHTTAPGSEMGQRLALRVLRDGLALQLARRGFDGLRASAMNLLAELTGEYIRALGTQLQHAATSERPSSNPSSPSPSVALVIRTRQLTNMRDPAEWRVAKDLYSRQYEPLHGSAAAQLMAQQQPTLGGATPPPGVVHLYGAVRGAWHYKQTHAGRAAHAQVLCCLPPVCPHTHPVYDVSCRTESRFRTPIAGEHDGHPELGVWKHTAC